MIRQPSNVILSFARRAFAKDPGKNIANLLSWTLRSAQSDVKRLLQGIERKKENAICVDFIEFDVCECGASDELSKIA